MTTTKAIIPQQDQKGAGDITIESTMHKLKLQWIMARDEPERQKVSVEIRRRLGIAVAQVNP